MQQIIFFLVLVAATLNSIVDTHAQKSATITFYANISTLEDWTGHVWVEVKNEEHTFNYGFYPDDDDPTKLQGLVSDKYRKADVSYSFQITEQQFNRTIEVIKEYLHADYTFGLNDCRRFAQRMAQVAGLNTPSVGMKSPAEWLADLVDAN